MSTVEIQSEVAAKLDKVRAALAHEITGTPDVCLTCSFQAEDVLLTKLAIELDPKIPVLFLDTGYHFAETYSYRDQIARAWHLNLINLLPEKTVVEQELEHGFLYRSAPDQCCKLRKVEPLFKAVANYRVWITGLRREQARSRTALEESAMFTLPAGKQVLVFKIRTAFLHSFQLRRFRLISKSLTYWVNAAKPLPRYHRTRWETRPAA